MTTPRFAPLPPERPADDVERELLARWGDEKLFEASLAAREGAPRWVFFEGPPTANGKPGIHHVFARTIKDLFCRHRAMKGFRVDRKAGWDTHGLPVEIEVEKALGISGKQDIERVGVGEFNKRCRESVFRYREDWEKLSNRIAFWLDYERAYVTYHNSYVESVWWALSMLHAKELLYQGHKILPYCPRCGTALSSHEVAQGYEDVEDPSVYLQLPLKESDKIGERRILVWTTTPWTLVSNAALAVSPKLTYAELRRKKGATHTIILAEGRVPAVLGGDWQDRWDVVDTFPGSALAGARYQRPLDWVTFTEGAREIIVTADFVSADDGTGVVHIAPAFGADDYQAGQQYELAFVQPVNARGEFPDSMPLVGGMFVKAADPVIVELLKERGLIWKDGRFTHSYPHCWRCKTPLLYYARSSWFVRTTAFKDAMLERNARVNWNPSEVGAGRFGSWLENNIDWAISRDRYWGTPLPVWVCDADNTHRDVIGSFAHLAVKTGHALGADFDPHKPHIDAYSWPCTECDGTMRRVPEVIDTWFDSGAMPFAQWHYPFENREEFARQYPGDFIAEGVDQTRGWFYSLLAIATGLGDALHPEDVHRKGTHLPHGNPTPGSMRAVDGHAGEHPSGGHHLPPGAAEPYRAVVVNDLVLDANGQKMSKTRGNTVDPWSVIERHGADAVRLFLVASSQVWVPRRFDEQVIRETAGRFLVTLKNVYSGIFAQYANFGWSPSAADPAVADRPLLDRWVLSRLAAVEATVDAELQRFDATAASRALMEFVTEDVANWYVRLSRGRFYEVDQADNRAAFATLHEVLTVVSRLLAPFAPFVSDYIHRALTGSSVHLADFTRGDAPVRDLALERAMEEVRSLSTLGRAAREEAGIKVRQPLSRLVCVAGEAQQSLLDQLVPLLMSELNVKGVEFLGSADSLVSLEAKANFRSLGKKWGKETPQAAKAVNALHSGTLRAFERGEPVHLTVGGHSHPLDADDLTVVRKASGALVVSQDGTRFAAIDPTLTDVLKREGLARELVSRVQRFRKESGLHVSDRITLWVTGPVVLHEAVAAHRTWICDETLTTLLHLDENIGSDVPHGTAVDLDGVSATLALQKVS
ncbi:MAG: isoleucine--tRNA ligase [Gemmatimonadota bacterium]|nr:isoleucine--tRNA ligase [Gemmatimonadota bacterium]